MLNLFVKSLRFGTIFNKILLLNNQKDYINQIEKITTICVINNGNFELNCKVITNMCAYCRIDISNCNNFDDIILRIKKIKKDICIKIERLIKKTIFEEVQERTIRNILGIC
ncbi:MAG: hypothetical protein IJK67_02615 [Bacilli bacterium]|nr:hypothetical protein [Bacilli bacterium]